NVLPPTTPEEYYNFVKAMTKGGIYGGSIVGGDTMLSDSYTGWMLALGADYLKADQTQGAADYPSKDSDVSDAILDVWLRCHDEKLFPPGHTTVTTLDVAANFGNGVQASTWVSFDKTK